MNKTNLQIALIKKGIPACGLAKLLGIDRSTLSRIMNGWIQPNPTLKKRISKILQLPLTELFPN